MIQNEYGVNKNTWRSLQFSLQFLWEKEDKNQSSTKKLKRSDTKYIVILSYTGGKCGKTCLVIIVLKKNFFKCVIDIKFLLTQYLNMALR